MHPALISLIIIASILLLISLAIIIFNRLFVYKFLTVQSHCLQYFKDIEAIRKNEYRNDKIEQLNKVGKIEINKEFTKEINKEFTKYKFDKNNAKQNCEKKVLIFFHGNIESYDEILTRIQQISRINNGRYDEIIIPHYPKYAHSFSGIGKNFAKTLDKMVNEQGYRSDN